MSDFDLRFKGALNTTHPIDLVFNEGESSAANLVNLNATIDAPQISAIALTQRVVDLSDIVPPPTFDSLTSATSIATLSSEVQAPILVSVFARVNEFYVAATIDPPEFISTSDYDNAVYRGLSRNTANTWQDSDKLKTYCESESENTVSVRRYVESEISIAKNIDRHAEVLSQDTLSIKRKSVSYWDDANPASSIANDFFGDLGKLDIRKGGSWGNGLQVFNSVNTSTNDLLREPRVAKTNGWGLSIKFFYTSQDFAGVADQFQLSSLSPWGETKKPNYGRYVKPVIPTPDGGYKPPSGANVTLIFKDKATTDTHILFGIKQYVPAKKIIPVKRAYAVINTFDLRILDTNERVETFALDMSIDMDSWTWGFSASVASSELVNLLPSLPGVPVVVKATVNGEIFHFLVESTRRNRVFGKDAISISGRGKSATLSDPYSPTFNFTNTQTRTAQQLMSDALMLNGVSIGWAVDWQIDDWLVPAGAWSHQGTYMSAVTAIATSAGAFVQPDPVNNTLRILPRNKVKPWELNVSAADIEMPSAVVETEGVTWEDRAKYDSVYVSGTTSDGVLGLVRRTGSASDKPAPMVTDPLITSAVAARQRGIYELSKFGPVVKRELSLPVLNETGIILPGAIVKYSDNGISNTGVVNGVRVNVSLPSIRQQISITSYD